MTEKCYIDLFFLGQQSSVLDFIKIYFEYIMKVQRSVT